MKYLFLIPAFFLSTIFSINNSALAGESSTYQRAGYNFSVLVGKTITSKYGKWEGVYYDVLSDGFCVNAYSADNIEILQEVSNLVFYEYTKNNHEMTICFNAYKESHNEKKSIKGIFIKPIFTLKLEGKNK